MKKILSIFVVVFALNSVFANTEDPYKKNYTSGDELIVVSQSGLKLRTEPSMNSRTLAIMEFGEQVRVIEDTIILSHYDRINWMEGRWIKVNYNGLMGFAFDGFLSSLPIPFFGYDYTSCEDIPILLEAYMTDISSDAYLNGEDDTYIESMQGENSFGINRSFPGDHHMSFVKTQNQTKTQLSLKGFRMPEVYNMILGLLDYCPEKDDIVDELIFIEDDLAEVIEIKSRFSNRLRITKAENNTILVHMISTCVVEDDRS